LDFISDQASPLKNNFNEAGHQQKKEAISSMGWQQGSSDWFLEAWEQ
jgi:hypothetical protein